MKVILFTKSLGYEENAQLRRQVKAMTNSQNETLIKDLRKENQAIKRTLKDKAQALSEVMRNWGDSRVRILSLESQLKLSKHRRKIQLTEGSGFFVCRHN